MFDLLMTGFVELKRRRYVGRIAAALSFICALLMMVIISGDVYATQNTASETVSTDTDTAINADTGNEEGYVASQRNIRNSEIMTDTLSLTPTTFSIRITFAPLMQNIPKVIKSSPDTGTPKTMLPTGFPRDIPWHLYVKLSF